MRSVSRLVKVTVLFMYDRGSFMEVLDLWWLEVEGSGATHYAGDGSQRL